MSLFPSTLTGRILDDGVTEPPVIELQGISAGQLSLVLTQYTPLETSTQHTALPPSLRSRAKWPPCPQLRTSPSTLWPATSPQQRASSRPTLPASPL